MIYPKHHRTCHVILLIIGCAAWRVMPARMRHWPGHTTFGSGVKDNDRHLMQQKRLTVSGET